MTGEAPVVYSFSPIADRRCRVLVLGTMPGEASLRRGEYYGHPRNAFWPIMASLLELPEGASYADRCRALLNRGIALWDVLARCQRPGSADADIREGVPNDIAGLLRDCPAIDRVFFNGAAAEGLYRKLAAPLLDREPDTLRLPSTSPAYALPLGRKREAWACVAAGG